VFSIGVGSDSSTSSVLRDLACGSGGQFQVLQSTLNVYSQMSTCASMSSWLLSRLTRTNRLYRYFQYFQQSASGLVQMTAPYLDAASTDGQGILVTFAKACICLRVVSSLSRSRGDSW
jgi:hypothetical protein